MTCVTYVGSILAIVYGMDAFVAYKDYKGFSWSKVLDWLHRGYSGSDVIKYEWVELNTVMRHTIWKVIDRSLIRKSSHDITYVRP